MKLIALITLFFVALPAVANDDRLLLRGDLNQSRNAEQAYVYRDKAGIDHICRWDEIPAEYQEAPTLDTIILTPHGEMK